MTQPVALSEENRSQSSRLDVCGLLAALVLEYLGKDSTSINARKNPC